MFGDSGKSSTVTALLDYVPRPGLEQRVVKGGKLERQMGESSSGMHAKARHKLTKRVRSEIYDISNVPYMRFFYAIFIAALDTGLGPRIIFIINSIEFIFQKGSFPGLFF